MDSGHKLISDRAIEKYYKNPNYCLNCGKVIEVGSEPPWRARAKKFCNRSCSATFHNKKSPKRTKIVKPNTRCVRCGSDTGGTSRKFCSECRYIIPVKTIRSGLYHLKYSWNTTKGDIKKSSITHERTRAIITKFARKLYFSVFTNPSCEICGYTSHVEVCHIIASSKFSDDKTLLEINDINNLIGLCPNHHWEFDNGIIPIEDINARIVQRQDD